MQVQLTVEITKEHFAAYLKSLGIEALHIADNGAIFTATISKDTAASRDYFSALYEYTDDKELMLSKNDLFHKPITGGFFKQFI